MTEKRKRGRPRKHPRPQMVEPAAPAQNQLRILPAEEDPATKVSGTNPSGIDDGGMVEVTPEDHDNAEVLPPVLEQIHSAAAEMPPTITEDGAIASDGPQPTVPAVGNDGGEVLPPMFSEKAVAPYADIPWRAIAKKYGNKWELTESEKELWTPAVTAILNKYVPNWLKESENKELWTLLMAAAIIAIPRSEWVGNLIDKIMQSMPAATEASTTQNQPSVGTDTQVSSESLDAENLS